MVSDAEVEESSTASATPEFEETLDELAIEMREVFAEEMQEELPALLEAARAWSNQGGRDHLVTLRRGFHTIKGSSRMVGLTAIGDWGWSYEHLLNQVACRCALGRHAHERGIACPISGTMPARVVLAGILGVG
ncbi:MAG: hypothetical protein B7X28_01355 [Halothiobacillus sp. 13-55-253]|nr:MAG: hypothetical protein B7X28_01355 [Halothiobacillus sp. 13-55-253]